MGFISVFPANQLRTDRFKSASLRFVGEPGNSCRERFKRSDLAMVLEKWKSGARASKPPVTGPFTSRVKLVAPGNAIAREVKEGDVVERDTVGPIVEEPKPTRLKGSNVDNLAFGGPTSSFISPSPTRTRVMGVI